MTDNEIIKALEGCSCDTLQEALDLINRQKTEIETWKEAFNNLDKIARPSIEYVENVKAEAIREFAEKLKLCAESTREYSQWLFTISEEQIDNLAKEMVGEES